VTTRGLVPPGLDATLVLVRHGESTYIAEGRFQGSSNPGLTELGERQASLVAERLGDPSAPPALPVPARPPLGCWHSPLSRAAAVAARVAAAQRVPVPLHVEDGFREIGQGAWEGRLVSEIQASPVDAALLAGWRSEPVLHHAPGGESLDDAVERVRPALGSLLASLAAAAAGPATVVSPVLGYGTGGRADPWAVVVGHDGIFRIALLQLFELPLERFWLFPFAQCAITVIDFRGGRPSLRAHNLDEYLAPLAEVSTLRGGRGDRQGGL
jgi:probable phosphoglycerate mutase